MASLEKELQSHSWAKKRELQLQGYSEEKIEAIIIDQFGDATKIGREFLILKPWYMKYKILGTASAVIGIGVILFFYLMYLNDKSYMENVRRNENNHSRVVDMSMADVSTSSQYSVVVNYPKIIGVADDKILEEINYQLQGRARMIVNNYTRYFGDVSARTAPFSALEISYLPLTVTSKIVSIEFKITERYDKENFKVVTDVFNYSIPNHSEIMLKDMFTTSDYELLLREKISENIHNFALNAQKYNVEQEKYFIELDTDHFVPTSEQFENFGLRYNGIIFYLNPDDINPVLAEQRKWGGEIMIDINNPLDKVSRLIKPEIKESLKEE
jgi:hypothetical protein